MADLEETGALEELLLLQRSVVDHAIYPLLENTPLGALLGSFQSTLLDLQHQEPSFWQLRVVEFIRNVLKARVGSCIDDAMSATTSRELQDPTLIVAHAKAQVQTSSELEMTLRQLQSDVENEMVRLKQKLNADQEDQENQKLKDTDEHFLTKFWEKLQNLVDKGEKQPISDEERGVEGVETGFESCSFENLTFDDDFNDISRSAMSFPCLEDLPSTVRRMESTDMLERASGLDELMQMPIVEIIHSGPIFPAACSAVVGLFLDSDIHGERCDSAERSKRVIHDLMNQVEDATQFLELYWAVLGYMGLHLETGELFLSRQDVCKISEARAIAVVDCFRVLASLLYKVIHHWAYFTAEAFAQLLHSTFRLLTMYSKEETEVEAKQVNPFMMLCLIDDRPLRWFKLWLINAPNSQQIFVAIDESGFIVDLLQLLSRSRPLASIKSSNPSVDAVENRILQGALSTLSYTCEHHDGRELVSRWQRLPAHMYIKLRCIMWKKPVLETIAADNDSVYRTVHPQMSGEESHEILESDYKHSGTGVIDALVLSITTMFTVITYSDEDDVVSYNEQWVECISSSVATYLHTADIDDLLAALVKLIEACWADYSNKVFATAELEENNPWFPFRHPKSATEVCQFVITTISEMTRTGILSKANIQRSGEKLLQMMLSSDVVTDILTRYPIVGAPKLLFELCKRFLQSWDEASNEKTMRMRNQSRLFELVTNITTSAHAFKVANQIGVVDRLWKRCCPRSPSRHHVSIASLCQSVAGVRYVNESLSLNSWMHGVPVYDIAAFNFREILACLSHPANAEAFFRLDGVQTSIYEVVCKLQEAIDFTVALNSPDDECPSQLSDLMGHLQLLQCCLSTQYASLSLLSMKVSPLIQFIKETLATHKRGFCTNSCHTEDTCCVALQLVLSLVSSVPAMLQCSDLLSELQLLKLDDKNSFQRDLLCSDDDILGSCAFLEKQLCYNFEFIGGPCEKLPQHELCNFDDHFRQNNIDKSATGTEKSVERGISDFAFTLQNKILQAIKDGAESSSSAPMDFVLISQASWELIIDLETTSMATPGSVTCKSAVAFTEMFAKIIYNLVMSKRSRLEIPVNSSANNLETSVNTATSSARNGEMFYPTDSARKLMNRWYKNYAHALSIASSPTLLHCIVKKFGKVSMDCFPVTILMVLYPTYEEFDILCFLSHCMRNPSAAFIWPSTLQSCNGVDGDILTSAAITIAEGVEIIMEREFPQVLQVIDQCHCSLLSLVQRWHSQGFWNYFDWENVVIYTYLSILYGAEFQVYCIVAILKHLEPSMRELTATHNSQSLVSFLLIIREPIRDFRFSLWRTFLLRLRSEYHEEIVTLLFPST